MSRKKKSRKIPSNGPVRLSQDKLKEMRALKEQRVKKTKGAKPGSRNAPDALSNDTQKAGSAAKDKRVGSKKAVPLVAPAAEPKIEMKRNLKPVAELKKAVEPELTPEQELGVDPNKNLINRLVSSKIYSVENSAKWITDEHEEGSYDYKLRNLEEDDDK